MNTTPAAAELPPITAEGIAERLRDAEAQLTAAGARLVALGAELTFWRDTSVALALDVQDMRGQLEARGVTYRSHLFVLPDVSNAS